MHRNRVAGGDPGANPSGPVGIIGKLASELRPFASPQDWLSPRALPVMSRRNYALELWATLLFAVALAVVDGGTIAVYAKQTWAGVVAPARLNLVVALIAAAPDIANILSFFWAHAAHGRPKVPLINALQVGTLLLIALVALMPQAPWGLYALALVVMGARTCWSGILTLRPTVWRVNYPRLARSRVVGRLSTVQVLVIACMGITLGWVLDHRNDWFEFIVPLAAAAGLGAMWAWARVRVRRQGAMLRAEAEGERLLPPWMGPLVVWRVLRRDRRYAQFMLCMFILGMGNLMLPAALVYTLKERFHLGFLGSILIISAIQYLVMPLAIPLWSRMLDRAHVVKFRSVHGWTFVAAALAYLVGVATGRIEIMFAGSVIQGIGFGGGTLAWNLGHVDFAPPSETSQYMATHVTLNGVRGLLAPLLTYGVYESLKAAGFDPSLGVMICVVGFTTAGAAGFVWLRRQMGRELGTVRRA